MNTPTPGRRVAGRDVTTVRAPRPRRTEIALVLLLVLGTGLGLWMAGSSPTSAGATKPPASSADLNDRNLVCPGASGDSTSLVGIVPTGDAGRGSITANGKPLPLTRGHLVAEDSTSQNPLRLEATGSAASGLFGSRVWRDAGQLAVSPCQEPRSSWYFVGAGGSAEHASVLELTNPRPGVAVADVEVYGIDGHVDVPGLRGLLVKHGEVVRLKMANVAPHSGDLAISVKTTRGLVSAAVGDRLKPILGDKKFDYIPAQASPSKLVRVTGLPDGPKAPMLLLANLGDTEALADVRLVGAQSTFAPTGLSGLVVPPESTLSIPMKGAFDGKSAAVLVSSGHQLLANVRATGDSDLVYGSTAKVWREPAAAAIPSGVDASVVVSSLGRADSVKISALSADGSQASEVTLDVPAGVTVSRAVPDRGRYVMVSSQKGNVVGAVRFDGADGLADQPLAPTSVEVRVPGVRPAW